MLRLTGINPMKPFDILVAGEINPDLILSGDVVPAFGQVEKLVESASLTIGSSSVIFACGAARLGLQVLFSGVCGDDIFGHFMLEEMKKRGVDVSAVHVDPNRPTGISVILSKGNDRAILTHIGAIADLCVDDITDNLLARARHLHVASYFLQTGLQAGLPQLFARAHTLGLTTSLDTNWDPSGSWRGFDQLLPFVDVFLPNENEALSISGKKTVEKSLDVLAQMSRMVVVKLGFKGAIARSNSNTVTAPSLKVNVVDTVGSGDSFDAGFIFGFLNSWSLEKSLQLACVCGSLSTQRAGGTAGQPPIDEALQAIA
jgi:sugar/nucleoside kinase (ribokinase family)